MEFLYHLVTEKDFKEKSDGTCYSPDSLNSEGFIHLSFKEQVEGTYKLFYSDFKEMLLLCVKKEDLGESLKIDFVESENTSFPHLYGKLELSSIDEVRRISLENGTLNI